jgi:hypothetical protein
LGMLICRIECVARRVVVCQIALLLMVQPTPRFFPNNCRVTVRIRREAISLNLLLA